MNYKICKALNFDLNHGTMTSDNVNRGILKPSYELKISEYWQPKFILKYPNFICFENLEKKLISNLEFFWVLVLYLVQNT